MHNVLYYFYKCFFFTILKLLLADGRFNSVFNFRNNACDMVLFFPSDKPFIKVFYEIDCIYSGIFQCVELAIQILPIRPYNLFMIYISITFLNLNHIRS